MAYVEGSAEYIASELGEKMFIEIERVGDNSIFYPEFEKNPYTYGWYIFKCIDAAMGPKKAVEMMLKGSLENFKSISARIAHVTKEMRRFFCVTHTIGRMYLIGMPQGAKKAGEAVMWYAPAINEGRIYMNEVWAIKNLREKKSILYKLGRFFRLIKHPWVEAEYIRRVNEKMEDFRYKVPMEIYGLIRISKLRAAGLSARGKMVKGETSQPQTGTVEALQKSEKPKYCYKCGAKMLRTAKFCPNCKRKQPR
jgi:hypothetical protein